jgi:chromosome segregation ATPase
MNGSDLPLTDTIASLRRERNEARMQLADHGETITELETEIERLRFDIADLTEQRVDLHTEIERLRAALQQIADDATPGDDNYCSDIARRALEQQGAQGA